MGFPILVRRHLYIESGPRLSNFLANLADWVPLCYDLDQEQTSTLNFKFELRLNFNHLIELMILQWDMLPLKAFDVYLSFFFFLAVLVYFLVQWCCWAFVWLTMKQLWHLFFKMEFISHAIVLTLKCQETHECIFSTVATDALVLKHQAISIHNAD